MRGNGLVAGARLTSARSSPPTRGSPLRSQPFCASAAWFFRPRGDRPLAHMIPLSAVWAPSPTRRSTRFWCLQSSSASGFLRQVEIEPNPCLRGFHRRGSSARAEMVRTARAPARHGVGCPVDAGMDPSSMGSRGASSMLPRRRGDRTRSSHTATASARGSPAHAGMDLSSADCRSRRSRLPCLRGDGPALHSSMNCSTRTPRPRGDGPCASPVSTSSPVASPAHAGMISCNGLQASPRRCAPAREEQGAG